MLLEQVTANVPTLAEIDDREDGETRNQVRAAFGAAAVSVGSIDKSDDETDAVDTLTNVLHHLDEISSFPDRLLATAVAHFDAERGEAERPILRLSAEARRVLGHMLAIPNDDVEAREHVTADDEVWDELRACFPQIGPADIDEDVAL
jgi:hypothetical protein